MVSQPMAAPSPAWPDDASNQHRPGTPGFEFHDRAYHTGPRGPVPPMSPPPAAVIPPRHDENTRAAPPAGSDRRAASAEWAKLLRSLLPQPPKRTWSRDFLAGLHFRGWATKVGIPILAMIVFGVAVVVIVGANGGNSSVPPAAALGLPPATLAGGEFAISPGGRGISQTVARVASDGAEIVAVGSQTGARIARAQFFFSPNDGRSWVMGTVRTLAGEAPPPGHAARFVAGGPGRWVAVGPGSIWTSADGRTWTLTTSPGMPLASGDQITALRRTAAGFIAVGANAPGGDQAKSSPVIFLSADGVSWRRLAAGQLRLPAAADRVLDIKYVAAAGNLILIAGDVVTTTVAGQTKRTVTSQAGGAWVSSDHGLSWVAATEPGVAPAGPGAQPQITGVAAAGDGFVLLRPATVNARPAVDVYRSANGTAWTPSATLSTPAGLVTGLADGGRDGAVVTGQAGQVLTAFVSADGASWQPAGTFGRVASESVSGVAMTPHGAVVTGTVDPGGQQGDARLPAIALLAGSTLPVQVDVAKIPGAFDPQLALEGVAAAGGMQVAVGSANGYPAVWASADGGSSWTRAAGATQAVFGRPGTQQLTSVTHGVAGWLAVGGVEGGATPHPVVVSSASGSSWQAADTEAVFGARGLVTEQAAAGPGGYVIVGYQDIKPGVSGTAAGDRTAAVAWWSAGLTGWQRAAGAFGGARGGSQLLAVTASARGFVAVGSAGDQASAWTSPDGRTWRQASPPVPVGATRTVLQHVASMGKTVVAVGTAVTTTGQQVPFAASSADGGTAWTESVLPVPAGRASVTALTAAGAEFTAAGMFGATVGHRDVVVWTSANGSAWKAVTPTGQGLTGAGIQAITGLTASANTLTGVGFTASPASEAPVFWQSPIR
jgi:hypothetical protein